jgi:1-acyl-sn-glycerol-3-phosphate acyltransferase/nitroimidazol reductase NimA-like FMN-containing flavoprotein (pyridoxamine 5'-phosphate oxidase superfamily)
MTDVVSNTGAAEMAVLSRAECGRLLGRGGLGRMAVGGDEGPPLMRPVNFAVDGDQLVVRTAEGPLWDAALRGAPASFEVDEIRNVDHRAWSVIVSGKLADLPSDDHIRSLPLRAWAPSVRDRYVALSMDEVSGRRLGGTEARAQPATRRRSISPTRAEAGGAVPEARSGIDHWGRSERTRSMMRNLLGPFYRDWFQVRWEGLEHLPPTGGALLVANHAGAVPIDAALIMQGLEEQFDRPVYALHHHGLREFPFLGTMLARNGGVVANPDNAHRLLRDEGNLVLVFPEGTKGTTKSYGDRYRLARFGRGGFAATAMRAGVPVVPLAVFGSEETMPTMFRLPGASEEGWPVTLNSLLFGPMGATFFFPAQITIRVLEPVVFDEPVGLDRYPANDVADATDLVRQRVQEALNQMLAARADARRAARIRSAGRSGPGTAAAGTASGTSTRSDAGGATAARSRHRNG